MILDEKKDFINFESINLKRADDIIERFGKKNCKVTRAEIILTNTCQLNCKYCQKHYAPNKMEKKINKEILLNTIIECLNHGCKFVHFTGGEATLCPELLDYVKICNKKGAEVTLSTNANSELELYKKLIEAGVNCFHISLDTNIPDVFDEQVGVKSAFDKVLGTIHLITKMRDEQHYKTRLIINTCITDDSIHNLVDIIKFIISLKPDDIKMIPISQLKDQWTKYENEYEKFIKPKLIAMMPEKGDFTMFKKRITNLVKPSFRGYNDKENIFPCYLSADERTIDPEGNYYGCYINYREGAAPVGNIEMDSFAIQSEKLRKNMLEFVKSDICQKYCADITVTCNKYIDKKIRGE